MSTGEIGFFYVNDPDAQETARAMERALGIMVLSLGDQQQPRSDRVHDELLNIEPHQPFVVFNGSGYFHNSTLAIVRDLIHKRRAAAMDNISYIHIDGHDDIAPPQPGNHQSFKSFVLGIAEVNDGGVHILKEGLTGERDGGFIIPAGPEAWGEVTHTSRDPYAYLSIDLDVLDINALEQGKGVYHLFPQAPIGFDVPRLVANIDAVGEIACLVGADIVGFSREGATEAATRQSLDNIARITENLITHFNK